MTNTPLRMSVQYPDCGHTVDFTINTRVPESCPACHQGILPGSTHCEDYPACGHTGRDSGCMPRPEHTSAYWSELRDRFEDDYEWDAYCDALDRQEMGY